MPRSKKYFVIILSEHGVESYQVNYQKILLRNCAEYTDDFTFKNSAYNTHFRGHVALRACKNPRPIFRFFRTKKELPYHDDTAVLMNLII